MDKNQEGQEKLKEIYKFGNIPYKIVMISLWGATIYFLILSIKYGYQELSGVSTNNMFYNCFTGFLGFAGILLLIFLLGKLINWINDKHFYYDIASLKKPKPETVNIETALHCLATNSNPLIGWYITFAAGFLFFLEAFIWNLTEKRLNIFSLVFTIMNGVLLVVVHIIGTKLRKKKIFKEQLLKNTGSYMEIEDEEAYVANLNEDLKYKILYYSKELIITENYFIGKTTCDIGFHPVFIPRNFIWNITFYNVRSTISYRSRMPKGYLKCQLHNGKEINYYIGTGARYYRALRALEYCNIYFREGKTLYE